MHQVLQHSTPQEIQNYSGSTVGTVAPAHVAVLPAVADMQSFPMHYLIPFVQCYADNDDNNDDR
jgi:hypothetical protein